MDDVFKDGLNGDEITNNSNDLPGNHLYTSHDEEPFTVSINEDHIITSLDVDSVQTELLENLDQMELHLECDDEPNIYVASVDNDSGAFPTSIVGNNVSLHISFSNNVVSKKERTTKKTFICSICNETFGTETKFCGHMHSDHQIMTPFPCQFCSYAASCRKLLVKHKNRRHLKEKTSKCTDEKNIETNANTMETNNVEVGNNSTSEIVAVETNPEEENVAMETNIKEDKYTSTHDNDNMEMSKDSVYKCKLCDLSFKQKKSLAFHMKRHAGDYSSQCEICSKKFVSTVALKRHMKIHNDSRPYVCELDNCRKSFKIRSMLTDHLRYVHKQNKCKSTELLQCSDQFHGSDVQNNIPSKSNSGIQGKQLCCTIEGCKKYFRDSYNLKTHVAIHSGKKEKKCPYCDFVCVQKTSLDWHLKSKHKNKA